MSVLTHQPDTEHFKDVPVGGIYEFDMGEGILCNIHILHIIKSFDYDDEREVLLIRNTETLDIEFMCPDAWDKYKDLPRRQLA